MQRKGSFTRDEYENPKPKPQKEKKSADDDAPPRRKQTKSKSFSGPATTVDTKAKRVPRIRGGRGMCRYLYELSHVC